MCDGSCAVVFNGTLYGFFKHFPHVKVYVHGVGIIQDCSLFGDVIGMPSWYEY